jgi:hypothetical protein
MNTLTVDRIQNLTLNAPGASTSPIALTATQPLTVAAAVNLNGGLRVGGITTAIADSGTLTTFQGSTRQAFFRVTIDPTGLGTARSTTVIHNMALGNNQQIFVSSVSTGTTHITYPSIATSGANSFQIKWTSFLAADGTTVANSVLPNPLIFNCQLVVGTA